jgi:hypothetical protein
MKTLFTPVSMRFQKPPISSQTFANSLKKAIFFSNLESRLFSASSGVFFSVLPLFSA